MRGPFGMTFNSMLDHLVHGEFDVDPKVVDFEGFLRDGRVYSYWGITCALSGCRFSSSIGWTWTSPHGPASSLTPSPA